MKYYYLDSERRICGPYSLPQLSSLLLSGTISRSTLCAAEGEKEWKALSEQSWMSGTAPGSSCLSGPPGNCPYCGTEQEGCELPPSCPSCGAAQAPKTRSLWSFFCLALRRLFRFKGRSQRKEYWAFVLFYSIILVLVLTVVAFVELIGSGLSPEANLMVSLPRTIAIYSTIAGILGWLIFPLFVRRLHDIGWSGKWALIPFVLALYGFVSVVSATFHLPAPEVTEQVEQDSRTMSADEFRKLHPEFLSAGVQGEVRYTQRRIVRRTHAVVPQMEDFNKQLNYPFGDTPVMATLATVMRWLNNLVSLLVIVIACIDSQRGANKYGPSYKYPRA